jgi:hypothetical protein
MKKRYCELYADGYLGNVGGTQGVKWEVKLPPEILFCAKNIHAVE